jgi:hypothetical protein
LGFVRDELFKLEERPGITILACVSLGRLPLARALANPRQVFQTDTGLMALRQGDDVFGETVVDMGDHASFTAFQLLHGPMFSCGLQLLASCGMDPADMANTARLVEDDRPRRGGSGHRNVLTAINPDPPACRFSDPALARPASRASNNS